MRLTILIPTQGERTTLATAIESVQRQKEPTEFIVGVDREEIGAGPMRNQLAAEAKTEWVGFCDDDDRLSPYYHQWLDEHVFADVVIFRMEFSDGHVIPVRGRDKLLELGNVGISFAIKRQVLLDHPFIKEDPAQGVHEDYQLLKTLSEAGFNLEFDERVAYYVG